MTEYMLVFAAAVVVMGVALNPKGFVTRAVSKSINMMFDSVEDMASEPCLGTIDDVDGGWHYTGSASYDCWTKEWLNLNAGCVPNCLDQSLDVGSGKMGLFLEKTDGEIGTSSCPCGYQGSPQRKCGETVKGEWGNLIPGTECTLKQCPKETFSVVPEPPVPGDFGPVNHLQTSTLDCNNLDAPLYRFEGEVSRDCDWCTYDTNNGWGPQEGACSAKGCGPSGSYDIGGGLWASFDPIGHGQTQTINCNSKNNTYTGTAYLDCAYGTWVDSSLVAGCRLFKCQTTYVTPPVANASSCGDDTSLTADEDWSVVGDCTSTKTCEWACDATFKKSGNNCKDTECYDPAPDGAVQCGDQKPLVDTKRWLSSTCTTNTMGEYQCDSANSYVYYNGSCCGNGAINGTEQCDKNGPVFNPSQDTCAEVNSSYNGGTLKCSNSCAFDTSSCCTWGSFSGWSHSNGYDDGNGGTCSAPCGTGTQSRTKKCMNGSTTIDTQSESQNCNTKSCACTSPCGHGDKTNGSTDTCYSASSVSCGNSCDDVKQTATCTNGSWSPSLTYTNGSCTPDDCIYTGTITFKKGYTVDVTYNKTKDQWRVPSCKIAFGSEV